MRRCRIDRPIAVALLVALASTAAPAFGAMIRPLADRVLIQVEAEEKTAGGIIIPDTAKEKPREGIVVEIGPGRFEGGTRVPMEVQPGDRVLFGSYAGSEVSLDGHDFLIMRESDIHGILEE